MNYRFTVVETSLNQAEFRWKWLRFLQHSAVLGIVLCALALAFGGAVLRGWITHQSAGVLFFAVLGALGFIAWTVVIISVMVGTPNRSWLAAAVERVDRRLLDRLNTLLFLEDRRKDPRTEGFALRIARQTQKVVSEHAPPSAFSGRKALGYLCAFGLVLVVTLSFYRLQSPLRLLRGNAQARQTQPTRTDKPLDLALPSTNNLEQNKTWGEVRITDPGSDMQVTKVDVVPMQIEAAANEALQDVTWFSSVNGGAETPHALPPPSEPRYAVYQPTFYLDELKLSDWDVVSYYAKANTADTNSYASDVYFLEVRPFREDILKALGAQGGGNGAYQVLNELSGLINRQQHVIRQTHQHLQRPPEQENVRNQDRRKLAEAESDLADSTQHLYANMAASMENKPIGDALDNLAQAQKTLDGASQSLAGNSMPQAQKQERQALSQLVAVRKMFQKAVTDNPGAFDEQQKPGGEPPPPVADASSQLQQMAEFRNEAKAAQDFVNKTLEQQRKVEQQTRTAPLSQYPRLGYDQQQLQKSLQDFQAQHPQVFKGGAQQQSDEAREAMGSAAETLQRKDVSARANTQKATQEMQKLSEAMQDQAGNRQLTDAYKLKQMLDQQARKLEQRAQPDSKMSDQDLQQTARDAQAVINQLQKSSEQEPTRDAFGQPLRDALSGQNKVNLDSRLMQVQQAQDEAAKQQSSGQAAQALNQVSKAFDQSQPKSLQAARQNDSLKPGDKDSFAAGMSQLQNLLNQLQSGRPASPENQGKQGRQALADLQNGMRSLYGNNEAGNQLLAKLDQMLKQEKGLDPGDLSQLLQQLQHFAAETTEKLAKKEGAPDVTNIDPTRLPPAYRGRIQKYFQKLSE